MVALRRRHFIQRCHSYRSNDSGGHEIRLLGIHTLDIQALLAHFFLLEILKAQIYTSPSQRLAALWTSFAMAYSQIEVSKESDASSQKRLENLQDTADFVQRLKLSRANSENDIDNDDTTSHGHVDLRLRRLVWWH